MGLLSKLKSVLGLDGADRPVEQGTSVTVERERRQEPEPSEEAPIVEEPQAAEPEPEPEPEPELEPEPMTAEEAAEPDAEQEPSEPRDAAGDAASVQEIDGIGPAYAERLREAGIETVADLAAADADELAEATDIAPGRIAGWIDQATEG